jgi:hypothetical protein
MLRDAGEAEDEIAPLRRPPPVRFDHIGAGAAASTSADQSHQVN